MKQAINYFNSSSVDGEFDRTSANGQHIYNMHTSLLAQRIKHSDEYCKRIIENTFFYDEEAFNFKILSKRYDVVIMALSSDVRQGLYRDRVSGAVIAAGDNILPINSDISLNILNQVSRIQFKQDTLKEFEERYEYIGGADLLTIKNNLTVIREALPTDTLLILIKYPLMPCGDKYHERAAYITACNDAVDVFCREYPQNIYALNLGKIVTSPEDITDDLLHFKRIIYYYISKEIAHIIDQKTNQKLNMPDYTLPYIPEVIQKSIYRLYDTSDFVIIGFEKESICLAWALRKKCRYIVDVSGRYSGEIRGIKVVLPENYFKDEQGSSALLHRNLLNQEIFIQLTEEKKLCEGKDMFVFP